MYRFGLNFKYGQVGYLNFLFSLVLFNAHVRVSVERILNFRLLRIEIHVIKEVAVIQILESVK